MPQPSTGCFEIKIVEMYAWEIPLKLIETRRSLRKLNLLILTFFFLPFLYEQYDYFQNNLENLFPLLVLMYFFCS